MPSLRRRSEQPAPVNPQVPIPNDFPEIPQEIMDRFPEARDWQRRLNSFWTRANQAIQEAHSQAASAANSRVVFTVDQFLIYSNDQPMPLFALDGTGVRLGDVLVVNTPGRKVYIGEGVYADDGTPFYVDTLGNFSLGSSLTWDPETDTLTIVGVINATSGTIGGFEIGADYIRDALDSFGLASDVTAGDDVRFWAGSTFATRNAAPLRIYESGDMWINRITIGNSGIIDSRVVVLISGTATGGNLNTQPPFALSNTPLVVAGANGQPLYGARFDQITSRSGFTGLTVFSIYSKLNLMNGTLGAIDNAYGLYIDTVDIGTSNWGLYVATTAKNYFAGVVQMANLAGVGTRNVVVDADGNLSAP